MSTAASLPAIPFGPAEPPSAPLRVHEPDVARLVVIIPALNEERTIAGVIRRVPPQIPGIGHVDIVVVNDGSSDQTAELARAEGAVVVSHPRSCGVGAAFQSGLRKAFELGADFVVNIDGDGQFAPEDIPRLVDPVASGKADFATASRFVDPAMAPRMPWIKRWGNRQVSRLISWLTGSNYRDVSCGMRAYNRDAALNLSLLETFTYTHEVFLHLTAKRMKLVEVPISVRGEREFGTSRVAGSVVRYAFKTLKIIFRFYRDYHSLKFFGYIAAMLLGVAAPLLGLCVFHYFATGSFSPHKWAGFTGVVLGCMGVASLFMGLLGDMLARQRVYMEEILYHSRTLIANESRRNP